MDRSWEYHAKWNKSDRKSQEPYDFIDMWDIKQHIKKQEKQTSKQKLIDTDHSMVRTRGKWVEG